IHKDGIPCVINGRIQVFKEQIPVEIEGALHNLYLAMYEARQKMIDRGKGEEKQREAVYLAHRDFNLAHLKEGGVLGMGLSDQKQSNLSRRRFLRSTGAGTALLALAPHQVLAQEKDLKVGIEKFLREDFAKYTKQINSIKDSKEFFNRRAQLKDDVLSAA